MQRVEGRLAKVLRTKPTVVTRAVFWKIPHNTKQEDVRLKLGRYKKSPEFDAEEEPESLEPKSELTLDQEEFKALIDFLQQSYEPFRQGVKAFIPLDRPFDAENAKQVRALFSLPDKRELVRFILENDVIPNELADGLRQAQRARAVREFRSMLDQNLLEGPWQRWFQANSWVLGSQFVRILDERHIDTENISDFLMEAYDGFLDVVEIKRPDGGLQFWASTLDHGNYVPSSDLTKAVTQASRYIYEVEREANSVKFLERVGGVKTVKPRCILVFGRSNDWNEEQAEAYRIMNASFHNLTVLTYDHVLTRARRIVGIDG
ncbi:MAG: Shedu anti-phage system protein SduA domain-containing protein [Burkholderiales bacterium]